MEENNMFVPEYEGQYTQEEIDVLNMEVTPEIEEVLKGLLLEKAMEDAKDYVPTSGPDVERELVDNIPLFEEYIRLGVEREVLQAKWEAIRYAKNTWWSLFKEEMDYNWLELDQLDDKLSRRMGVVAPTSEQWDKAMSIRSMVYQRCVEKQNRRRVFTYSIYEKAMVATKKAQEFWSTREGKQLNNINERRSLLWGMISDLNVSFNDYNNLLDEDLNRYWISGDTEEVDAMELMATNVYETLDLLEETHALEMAAYNQPESKGYGFWSNRDMYKTNKGNELQSSELAYQASLMEFMTDYLDAPQGKQGNNNNGWSDSSNQYWC